MGCPDIAGAVQPGGAVALIGRDREMRLATELLDDVVPGRASVLVVEGPPGAGRSRLLREVAAVAGQRGMTVVPEPRWTSAMGARRELRRWSGAPRPLLFRSDRPLRIEPRAWDVLDELAESAPVLVAVSAAPGADPVPVERLTSPAVRRVPLAPLSRAETRRLAGALLGMPPGPELGDLLGIAAGRPGLVRDLIAGLREEGLVRPAFGQAVLTSPRLPRRTESWVRAQLAALSPPARHLVQAATTLRSPFPLVQLTGLLRVSPVAVVPAVEEALASGLIAGDGDLLSVTHDRVRAIVTAGLPRPVAAALRAAPPVPAAPTGTPGGTPGGPATRTPTGPAGRTTGRTATRTPAAPATRTPTGPAGGAAPERPRVRVHPAAAPRTAPVDPGPGTPPDWGVLSEREREIAALAGRALTNRQIAHRVGISPHTVNYHLRQVFQKLGMASRVELAARWRELPEGGPSAS